MFLVVGEPGLFFKVRLFLSEGLAWDRGCLRRLLAGVQGEQLPCGGVVWRRAWVRWEKG